MQENLSKKTQFAAMAKPVGSLCNMRCSYCYYLETGEYSTKPDQLCMTDELLEEYIRQYITGNTGPAVSFVWHGGEPTLAGIDFYRHAVELQKKYLPAGWQCWNNLQTNGLLLNDEWCDFLAENNFDVGLSIDGSQYVHDTYRRDAGGNGTYERIHKNAQRLVKHGIRPDLLCTVTSTSSENPLAVYRGLRELNTGWVQFIPIIRRDKNGNVTPDSITPDGYGKFLCDIFDEWILNDLGRTDVQLFAETAMVLSGGTASLCWMAPTCGKVLIVEHDGNVYSCDHFVNPEYRIGNIETAELQELINLPEQIKFGSDKRAKLPSQCKTCDWKSACNGGCPKDRFAKSDNGEEGLYYLCNGLRTFFSHAAPRLKRLMQMRSRRMTPAAIMAEFRNEELEKWKGIGRNDPCPCGSGKKAKNCCWNKRP